ncbi:hypothetical protein K491DRAFT_630048 [Lophiostoma macrostomum CBS 122681]|uniref:Uncharacterized protein n=1 Tax=Lophiostoma macrostomum CBS 122681 TaxID=1314788 RepID=A0A6A6T858_9PLEO|nr:hypothetical protein K491DRAFT_630048 [Lophiostoma macrostomum CBS 122681]
MSSISLTMRATGFPFPEELQLNTELEGFQSNNISQDMRLPGQPNVRIDDHHGVWSHLEREFYSSDLEQLAPRLWLMSMQSSANISPLHRQRVKNRRIVVTEDPKLHLVWDVERIFIKPLPPFLLSHAFWTHFLQPTGCVTLHCNPSDGKHVIQRERIIPATLGFLRTYTHLIRYDSDFRIAQDEHLLPQSITYIQFSDLMSSVAMAVQNVDVSGRYNYGELRLSRLNCYCKVFLRKFYFHRRHSRYGSYFSQFFAPLLFVFGMFSVMLSAMQVAAAGETLLSSNTTWYHYWQLCRWLGVLITSLIFAVIGVLFMLFSYRFVSEWAYAIRDRVSTRLSRKTKAITSMV